MTFPFHIHQIIFKDTQYEKSPQLDFELSNVTILVGPNNSGKSQILKDIENYCFGIDTTRLKILKDVVFANPEQDSEIQDLLTTFKSIPSKERGIGLNQIFLSSHDFRESGNRRLEYNIDVQEYTARIKQSKVSVSRFMKYLPVTGFPTTNGCSNNYYMQTCIYMHFCIQIINKFSYVKNDS